VNGSLTDDLRWLRDAGGPAARLLVAQGTVQGIAAAASFLFVRGMSKEEFGWLTIATGFLTTVSVLADSGMGAGLQAIAGRVWKDPAEMGQLIVAARQTRHRLAALVAVVLGPAFAWLLARNGARVDYAIALALLSGATVWFTTEIIALSVAARMYSRYHDVQFAEAGGAAVRLVVAAGSLLRPSNAALGAAAGFLSAGVQRFRLRHVLSRIVPMTHGPAVPAYRRELTSFLRPLAIPTFFFMVQGQLGVWILGLFGRVQSVADLGALSRFAVLLSIITAACNQVAAPSFARADTPNALGRQVRRILGLGLLAFAAAGGGLLALPSLALRLLGPSYGHLANELRLVVGVSLLTHLTAMAWSLATAKGWVRGAWLVVPVVSCAQLGALLALDISTVAGALCLSLLNGLATLAVYTSLVIRGFRHWQAQAHA
jgi:O-antigen/teichoic acid export membrane protein